MIGFFRCVYCGKQYPFQDQRNACEQRHEDDDRRIAQELTEKEEADGQPAVPR